MSLVDPRSVAFWPMLEQADSVHPSDATGNLADLDVPTGLVRPVVAHDTPTGFGREFDRTAPSGFTVGDPDGLLRLARGLTIASCARLDVEDLADDDIATLIQRGTGGASDQVSFGLAVEVLNASDGICRLFLFWEQEDGTRVEDEGITFQWPPGAFLILAATREVVAGLVAVRYLVNEQAVNGEQDHPLDIGGALDAGISVGTAMAGASFEGHWDGVIDSLQVLNEAVSPEELELLWYRCAVLQPQGYQAIRRLVPPGVYSSSPDSSIQRELMVEGMAVGYAKALARRLRYGLFPDVAWGAALERWEAITGNPPKPGDDIDTRQARILRHTSERRGPSIPDYKARLAAAFDLDVADIEIIENDNDYAQDFATDPDDAVVINGNATWAVTGGVLRVDTGAGGTTNADVRYLGRAAESPLYLVTLPHARDAWVYATITIGGTGSTGATMAGVVFGSRSRGDWFWVGVQQSNSAGPVNKLAWVSFVGREYDSGIIDAAWDTSPTVLHLHYLPDRTVDIRAGVDAAAAAAATPVNVDPGLAGWPEWTGFGLVADAAEPSEAASADFDDLFVHAPYGTERGNWYAYRDPGLPGSPDMELARRIVAQKKQAHTSASAVTTLQVLCDDPDCRADREPIGK